MRYLVITPTLASYPTLTLAPTLTLTLPLTEQGQTAGLMRQNGGKISTDLSEGELQACHLRYLVITPRPARDAHSAQGGRCPVRPALTHLLTRSFTHPLTNSRTHELT